MALLQNPWVAHLCFTPIPGNKALLHAPKTPIWVPPGHFHPRSKNKFSLSTHQASRVPTWSLYNTHGVSPLCLAPFLVYTWVIPLLNHIQNGPTPRLVPTVSLKERVFPGYPHTPKTPILGPTRTLSPKVFPKNEFSQGTHQAGWVPTWPLYNTHWVAPLCLVPFLGYTGVIPLLNHNQNGPHPQTLVPTVSLKKTVFP